MRSLILTGEFTLREAGAIVTDVICIIERNPEGRSKLEEIGLKVHSLFKMEERLRAGNVR